MCGGDCAWRHTALCLYFDVFADLGPAQEENGCGEGVFSSTNDSMQVRLGAHWLNGTQTEENYRCRRSGEERRYSPWEVKWQAVKARSRKRSKSRFGFHPLWNTKGDEERHRVSMLPVGHIGANHLSLSTSPSNHMLYSNKACCVMSGTSSVTVHIVQVLILLVRWAREEGPKLNVVFTSCNEQILTPPLKLYLLETSPG